MFKLYARWMVAELKCEKHVVVLSFRLVSAANFFQLSDSQAICRLVLGAPRKEWGAFFLRLIIRGRSRFLRQIGRRSQALFESSAKTPPASLRWPLSIFG